MLLPVNSAVTDLSSRASRACRQTGLWLEYCNRIDKVCKVFRVLCVEKSRADDLRLSKGNGVVWLPADFAATCTTMRCFAQARAGRKLCTL